MSEFAKKTGDFKSLSAVDLRILGLAYQLEKEFCDAGHIKKEPYKKVCLSSLRERDRERQRETDRERQRQRQRETDRDRQRQRQRETERDRESERESERDTERDRERVREGERERERESYLEEFSKRVDIISFLYARKQSPE